MKAMSHGLDNRSSNSPCLPSHTGDDADMKEGSASYRTYVLVLMLLIYMTSYLDRTLVGILAPLIKKDLHLTDTQLGLVNGAAFALVYASMAIPFGWLADRYSRTRIISVALAFWSIFTALFGLATNFTQILLARTAVGLGEAGGAAPSHSLLIDYFPRSQRARVMAVYGFGIPLGVAAGSAMGGLASLALGWRAAFIIAGVIGCVLALVMKLTVREPGRAVLPGEIFQPQAFWMSINAMLAKPGFVVLCLGATCGSIVGFSRYFWLPSYFVRSFHLTVSEVAAFVGPIEIVAGISGGWIGAWISDRISRSLPAGPAIVTAISYLIATPLLAGMLFTYDIRLAWILLALVSFFASIGMGPIVAATQHFASANLRGTAASIMNFVLVVISMGVAVPLIGHLSDMLLPSMGQESLRYALLTLPIFYVAGALLYFYAAMKMERIAV